LIGSYYVPPDSLTGVPLFVVLTVALSLLATARVFQVWATVGTAYPGVRAVEAPETVPFVYIAQRLGHADPTLLLRTYGHQLEGQGVGLADTALVDG
jgi:hypothetical protein